ncbi:MAG: Glu/Leu/Phe/Val dehydrogenase [Cyanobacteria bacterium SZAS LIN-3]|nr:Glu/Leu/Phe/Val dehydrogenase [Cyanobacteria bacterium SZAS LIN-3]MBS2010594.1 Glu/Leu/Phe/Val dehydrogenase [Cyanobacteria bacterium SZAS TMP-1]
MMMGVFHDLENYGHEQVTFFHDKETGLKAIIGVHSTVLGPSLGGCRMWKYTDEQAALRDVLRLSRGMTYKAAVAGLKLGGGKAVVMADARTEKTPELLAAFGRAVESLHGKYITAEDVGMSVEDIDTIRKYTKHAVGGSNEGGSGDPSVMTAFGVFQGIKAAVKHAGMGTSLEGIKVAIQGVGHVGYHLASYLSAAGAKLIISDIYPAQIEKVVQEFGAVAVEPDQIYGAAADIFAPCALGAILNQRTIPQLKCKIVAGSANNQLEVDSDGFDLFNRGIVYAPDYAINSGGLINVAAELDGYNHERVLDKVSKVYNTIADILERSKEENIPPHQAADRLAEQRLVAAKMLKADVKETVCR